MIRQKMEISGDLDIGLVAVSNDPLVAVARRPCGVARSLRGVGGQVGRQPARVVGVQRPAQRKGLPAVPAGLVDGAGDPQGAGQRRGPG